MTFLLLLRSVNNANYPSPPNLSPEFDINSIPDLPTRKKAHKTRKEKRAELRDEELEEEELLLMLGAFDD